MVKAKKYVVQNYFKGLPKLEDYSVKEEELPALKDGEILVKAEWISIDPYQRPYNAKQVVPYDQIGYQVGKVEESKNPEFPVGTKVVTHKGWTTYSIANPQKPKDTHDVVYKLPDMQGLPESLALGAVGLIGAAAYFGLLEICKPKAGETVVVNAAAGALGSLVGQIAKIKGCRVIGFAGTDAKVQWVEKELGFDKAINYKTADVVKELEAAAPNGVDIYFDNVGGELSSLILTQMNDFGRVAVSGSISSYNDDPKQFHKVTLIQPVIVFRQLKVEGFVATRWVTKWPEAFMEIFGWIKSGQLKTKEHIIEGFDKVFEAFIGMLNGENFGKTVVKV